MKYSFYLWALGVNLLIWLVSYILPRLRDWMMSLFRWDIGEGIFIPVLLCLPLILCLNFGIGTVFRMGIQEMNYSMLFVGLVMVGCNVLVYSSLEILISHRIGVGDLVLLGFVVIGIASKYWVEHKFIG